MTRRVEQSMYEKFLELPLFQGIGLIDLNWILGKVQFNFKKHEAGGYIVEQDSYCDSLIFIMSGKIQIETLSIDKQFCVSEFIEAPAVIQPEVLFGSQTRYTHSYKTLTETATVSINKTVFWDKLFKYQIFQLNFLNYISAQAQHSKKLLWRDMSGTIRQRTIQFVLAHCTKPAGKKIVKIKMEHLATQLSETRNSVSRVLNELESEEKIALHRGSFVVHKMEELITEL